MDKGKNILRAKCKLCCIKTTKADPKHKEHCLNYYYKHQEKQDANRMKLYIKNRTGVCLVN